MRKSRNDNRAAHRCSGEAPRPVSVNMVRDSYAVIWREGEGPVKAGELVLGPTRLRLETGARRERLSAQSLRYEELASVATAVPGERLHGRPTAVVERRGRDRLSIATIEGGGSVSEIVERVARLLPRRTKQ